jgi:hypothetical protein
MNEALKPDTADEKETSSGGRRLYLPPTLTLFGHVAALTQGSNCSANTDGTGSCPSAGGTSMGKTSDRRLKHDIIRIGDHPLGFGLYLFSYRPSHRDECGHGRHFGVMADEVEPILPEAISVRADGYKAVNYDLLGIRPQLH